MKLILLSFLVYSLNAFTAEQAIKDPYSIDFLVEKYKGFKNTKYPEYLIPVEESIPDYVKPISKINPNPAKDSNRICEFDSSNTSKVNCDEHSFSIFTSLQRKIEGVEGDDDGEGELKYMGEIQENGVEHISANCEPAKENHRGSVEHYICSGVEYITFKPRESDHITIKVKQKSFKNKSREQFRSQK